jgi:predicted N-acetyltransferase YhbS
MIELRPEAPDDHAAVRALLREAFEPYGGEAELVDALRAEGAHVPELCLVAVDGAELTGHVFFSRARLASGHQVLALAPMAVAAGRQGEGIGSRLATAALERAAGTTFPLVVVLGHPGYYPRFGFRPAAGLAIQAPWDVPPEAWMALPLPAYDPAARGLVTYAAAFGASL